MKVIFLKDVPRVGNRHDIKEVNDGYAMNFLLARKLAEIATPSAISALEKRKKEIVIQKAVQDNLLMKNLEELKDKVIVIKSKCNAQGHLFSAIHKKEIITEMRKTHNAEINEEYVILDKPIKSSGEYDVPIEIKGKKSSFKLKIEPLK